MKRNLFILPALVLAISLAFANTAYACSEPCDNSKAVKEHKCCCKDCKCKDCGCEKCVCDENCKCGSKIKLFFKHKPCDCCTNCGEKQ